MFSFFNLAIRIELKYPAQMEQEILTGLCLYTLKTDLFYKLSLKYEHIRENIFPETVPSTF